MITGCIIFFQRGFLYDKDESRFSLFFRRLKKKSFVVSRMENQKGRLYRYISMTSFSTRVIGDNTDKHSIASDNIMPQTARKTSKKTRKKARQQRNIGSK